MQWTFSQTEAQLVFGFLASILVPFAVAWLKRCAWPDWLKLLLAAAISLLAAALSQYAAGALDGGSVVVAALGIFTAAQAHFASWFRGLGFDAMLNPDTPTRGA